MLDKKNEGKDQSGLLNNSKPVFLAIAKIHKPHGLNGEVTVELLTDFPERIIKGKQIFIGEGHVPKFIDTVRKIDRQKYLISFLDHNSRDSVSGLCNQIVYVQDRELPDLSNDGYYHHDLIGMKVFSVEDREIGVLSEIIFTGASDVYVIRPLNQNMKEILIPAIKSVVVGVDTKNKKMTVKLQEWR